MKLLFTYFRSSGKYYSEGFVDIECEEHEVGSRARQLQGAGDLPGLECGAGRDLIILVEPIEPDGSRGVPRLIEPWAKDGARLITSERIRQELVEKFKDDDDDRLTSDQLPRAAACYLAVSSDNEEIKDPRKILRVWPFKRGWWKPTDNVRNLVKAGALIAAEIDRLLRKQQRESQAPPEQPMESVDPETNLNRAITESVPKAMDRLRSELGVHHRAVGGGAQ